MNREGMPNLTRPFNSRPDYVESDSTTSRKAELKKLVPRHFKILDLYRAGNKIKDIALAVGMTPAGVRLVIASPLFQKELSESRRGEVVATRDEATSTTVQARQVLERASLKAAETQESLLEEESPKIRLAASNSILDRVFDRGGGEGIVISAETINLLQVAVRESAGNFLELEPEREPGNV